MKTDVFATFHIFMFLLYFQYVLSYGKLLVLLGSCETTIEGIIKGTIVAKKLANSKMQ